MTNQPYDGATPQQLRHPLVRELLAVHNMFRNELARMLEFVNELLAGEQQLTGAETDARTKALIRAGIQYTQMLHMHHHLESTALFPVLQKEEPGIAPVVDRLNADHDEIAIVIDQFKAGIRNFAAIEPDVTNSDLRRLADALHAHLAYEETHVCPVLARFSGWPMFNSVD